MYIVILYFKKVSVLVKNSNIFLNIYVDVRVLRFCDYYIVLGKDFWGLIK